MSLCPIVIFLSVFIFKLQQYAACRYLAAKCHVSIFLHFKSGKHQSGGKCWDEIISQHITQSIIIMIACKKEQITLYFPTVKVKKDTVRSIYKFAVAKIYIWLTRVTIIIIGDRQTS